MDLCQTLLTSTKQGSTTSDSEFLRVVSSVCVCSLKFTSPSPGCLTSDTSEQEWACSLGPRITTELNMIQCDGCDLWIHWYEFLTHIVDVYKLTIIRIVWVFFFYRNQMKQIGSVQHVVKEQQRIPNSRSS